VNRANVDVLVIGAGVTGLTTAICLAERGLHVRIWAAEPPQATTSAAAGAMWGPYLVEPVDRVRVWSDQTLDVLQKLAADHETGVRLVSGVEASRTPVDPPTWGPRLAEFRMCEANELPDGFVTGWRFTAPTVDMPVYLTYLQRRLSTLGVDIELRHVASFDEPTTIAPVVVNCTGVGAHDLVSDPDLTPIRGQLVIAENPGISEFFSEDTGLATDLLHFYPHRDTVILGGTAEPGMWRREPDPATAAAIIARCADVEPRLRDVHVIGHRVGLRPARPQVRLQEQPGSGARVIHNYGHGGAGVTLSWGCATEVASLV
jgi:D-amino-acid oxidase